MPRLLVAPEVESCRRMIAGQAIKAWRMLPRQTQSWLSVEDLIQEGLVFAQTHALPRYSKERSPTKFSTYLYGLLQNFYATRFVQHHSMQLRCDRNTVSIEGVEASYRDRGMEFEFERVMKIDQTLLPQPEVDLLAECRAVDSFIKVYNRASPTLQEHLVRWFLRPQGTKYHTHGRRFIETSKEFRSLSLEHSFDINDCRHLMQSPTCLDSVSRSILSMPYCLLTAQYVKGIDRRR